tara:strand:+ start:434 stop:634 length:201 start_codon:yes stop_codon:yes gene_type:complete
MTKTERIKTLIKEIDELKKQNEHLQNVISDFYHKMNSLLTFCKIQDKQTSDEIIQSKFNNMYQDND